MNIAIILLGGSSKRLNLNTPKQFIKLNDKELFEYSLETFAKLDEIDQIILVTGKNYYEHVYDIVNNKYSYKNINIVIGGETRQESVFNALSYLKDKVLDNDVVLIHDSSRPLVTSRIIIDHLNALQKEEGTSTYVDIFDSIIMKENGYIKTYVPREDYFLVQTPQGFKFKDIHDVHEEMKNKNQLLFTDDASLLVKKGKKIKLIYGDRFNFKITTLDDLMLLRSILEAN